MADNHWNIKQLFLEKIQKINKMKQIFDARLGLMKKAQKWEPQQKTIYTQEQIEALNFKVENLMRFDSIESKLDRLRKESEMKCGILKDNIKTAKLKLSLSEMEYK